MTTKGHFDINWPLAIGVRFVEISFSLFKSRLICLAISASFLLNSAILNSVISASVGNLAMPIRSPFLKETFWNRFFKSNSKSWSDLISIRVSKNSIGEEAIGITLKKSWVFPPLNEYPLSRGIDSNEWVAKILANALANTSQIRQNYSTLHMLPKMSIKQLSQLKWHSKIINKCLYTSHFLNQKWILHKFFKALNFDVTKTFQRWSVDR